MVGHAEAIWVESEDAAPRRAGARASRRRAVGAASRSSRLRARPRASTTCSSAASAATRPSSSGLALFLASDNLRKGAALNAIQIAELLLERTRRRLTVASAASWRFFPLNWRPPASEMRFAQTPGFDLIQIRSRCAGAMEDGLPPTWTRLGAAFTDCGGGLDAEMLVRHEGEPRTIPWAKEASLAAISPSSISRVHVTRWAGPRSSRFRRRAGRGAATRRRRRASSSESSTTPPHSDCWSIRARCSKRCRVAPRLGRQPRRFRS